MHKWTNYFRHALKCTRRRLTFLFWGDLACLLLSLFSLLSHVRLFTTPWTATRQASLSFTIFQSLLNLMSIELVIPSNHLILCCLFLFLPSVFPNIRVFSTELAFLIGWPKYWSFSFSISPSNEYLGLISFKIDWFDLLAVQATLKSLLQHHSLKASILWPKYEWILGGHAIYFETASQVVLVLKNLPAGARGSVPALGRSPGGGHGNPL